MRLLQALFFPPEQPGGVSSMIPYMQERFSSSRWEMEMFWLPRRLRNKGREDIVFDTFDWTVYAESEIVQKYIQTYRDYIWWTRMRIQQPYELIHAHHPIAGLAFKHVFPNVPLIQTIHSSYERELILNGRIEENGLEHQFLVSLYRELEMKSERLITVSQSFAGYISSYVDHPDLINVIPNGFDEKRFKPVPHENEVPQLVCVCRLVPAKGLDILFNACAELKKRGYDYVLHIIGDGPFRKELETLAQDLGIYNETIFYGYTLHPEEFVPFFDIFVLPSRAEAFGSVFAEAALSCLALVGTDVGGIPEQIEDGVNGLLVPVEDYLALSDALEKLISDPSYRYELARSAWEKAKSHYSLTHVVNELKKMYLQFDGRKSEE
ncbi:glycosyltransferase family 4 protein [Paenibacillus macquariensis]|uniref:Glycosyltransferase involved in cell wall bisynthesis n=1 Tax=Paenibacillus macquariensis TaxID=948756 RepID=A0ABY1JYH2_9BACL|nr:glycosyltransferase family 4 protein [Paenibacillus macquariensis]MEC0089118.1 glycosyltransferase family 4 protein [Paenibacillus macquariensis]OAB33455.1 glycosyl transferase [Paenibacillus macquariensis subsp. macquariensis]SIQ98254.1 Glycosyltransferase involved in cell wall bisynthesis [Paenibacillus macquariensis]